MTISAVRITKDKHSRTAFSGAGAKVTGGRWNSPGTAVVYCAGSTSLAILEVLVHIDDQDLLEHYVTFEVTFDSSIVEDIVVRNLPKSWTKSPAPPTVQQLGDEWIAQGRSAVLRVPSAVVPTESNFLVNPAHPDFKKIVIGPKRHIEFDPRLTVARIAKPPKRKD